MFVECDNSSIVVSVNKHYNVANVPPLLQVLEVATPRFNTPIQGSDWHYYHISLATDTQRCYVAEQQCYIQSCIYPGQPNSDSYI